MGINLLQNDKMQNTQFFLFCKHTYGSPAESKHGGANAEHRSGAAELPTSLTQVTL